jgi:hypothetical protein
MPIDAGIYSQIQQPQIESPINAMAKVAALQNAQNQNKLFSMQAQDAEEARAGKNALAEAYKANYDPVTGQINRSGLFSSLAQRNQGAQIPGLQKTFNEQDKAQREADKAKLEGVKQHIDLQGQLLGGVKDQNSWTQALQIAQQNGIDVSKFPQQYDPATVQQLRQRALSAKDQVEQEWKAKNYDLDVRKVGISAGNLGLARERLAYDKGQPKGQYDAASGMLVDTRTGTARPVVGPDGQPIVTGGGKPLTEDQAKASGWLAQSENAFNNMKSAIKEDTGAAKPGLGEAVGAVPLLGAAGNYLKSANRQKYSQASSSLSEALLRAATGAGVNENEAKQKISELTPQFGDSDAVIKQKMDSIPVYIESLKIRSSPRGAAGAAQAVSKSGSQGGQGGKPSLDDIFK